jgi:glucose/arabinose dehydrogenase
MFAGPIGVAVDTLGYVYVSDHDGHIIRSIDPSGGVTTLAGSYANQGFLDGAGTNGRFYNPAGIAVDGDRAVYIADYSNGGVRKITTSGVVYTLFQGSFSPVALTFSSDGSLYVSSATPYCISIISTGGSATRSVFAGQGDTGLVDGVGTLAYFGFPYGIAFNSDGLLFVADYWNHCIRTVDTSGRTSIC